MTEILIKKHEHKRAMKRIWLNILLDKIKELGEDPKTLMIDGDTKSVFQEVWQYDWGGYDNEINMEKFKAYTTNYIYWYDLLSTDSYQLLIALHRNPSADAKTFDEIMRNK
ncbi:unnamed protein product [Commensalibacter communis]|uniref:hypothetical protein n=1 Tax=Commensalibacter communis TaxID=2972786 RepID=UPI0022FF4FB8|nr:hypothetical protein [Commensalibacter communis]CAI3953458.1 unnamed protein product [Commensalibacter communis]CAI3959306.1 unnamed protein product [Commensalibacter communis]